jgi:hypothetical protein
MPYTLLRGSFVIRYPDLPRQGPEPDGDTIKFRPDTPALVEALPRRSGVPPDINARGISARLEAIDALETHFQETHQELTGANAARDELLRRLGFTNIRYFDDLPNKVQSADQDTLRGHVLSNGIDANGRLIALSIPVSTPGPTAWLCSSMKPWSTSPSTRCCWRPGMPTRRSMPPSQPTSEPTSPRSPGRPGPASPRPEC